MQISPERTTTMTSRRFARSAAAVAAFTAIVLAGIGSSSPRAKTTDDDNDGNESRIQRGLEIAPVQLNLDGKNRALVGLGSYIVNAHVPCNECHGAGLRSLNFSQATIPTLASQR